MIVAKDIKKVNHYTAELCEYFDIRNEFVVIMELPSANLSYFK
jgi:hypothetical protein